MTKLNKIFALSAVFCITMSQAVMIPAKVNAEGAVPEICLSYVNNEIPSGALYMIKSVHSGRFLTADDDTNVCQRDYVNSPAQLWRIVCTEEGYVKLLCENNLQMALTVEDVSILNGSNIGVAEYSGADAQKFRVNKEGLSYYITTKTSENKSSLDIKGKSKAEGANVHQYKYQGNSNQLF
ncbi:MAG: RICIN domain-containing protein [Oscillospiraceae bacterium]|nr:RICIN domain-containing protein [Oscillospiraceae bacterium]